LYTNEGDEYPLKPGTTWFEVMGVSTTINQNDATQRFEMRFP
jgi:hypothetical protein